MGLSALCVFRNILHSEPMTYLMGFLEEPQESSLFGAFTASLAPYDFCFSSFLKDVVLCDENRYITTLARGQNLSDTVKTNAHKELRFLSGLTELSTEDLTAFIRDIPYIPVFFNEKTDIFALYEKHCVNVNKTGYGIFASATMFRWTEEGPAPESSADTICVNDFTGYDAERKKVEDNILRLLQNKPAANMLLFGEAGTGKSSTIKALVNKYASDGLRLIELKKNELFRLPDLMGRIRKDPLKFIVFIDDLSFTKNDDQFSMLKSVLEGAAGARAENAVIAATSNRRHIIKESFSERDAADDIHRNDTVNELMSLSDRFGLCVYFGKPDKKMYLQIIRSLALQYGIPITENLENQAEVFALRKGSRSPRAARQFIESVI